MADEKIKSNATIFTLKLDGSLTVQRAGEIKGLLKEALTLSDNILIDNSEAEEFDLTYLQCIFSAHQTYQPEGKRIKFASNIPGALVQLIEDSGFLEIKNLIDAEREI